jgi:hypothetical protein
MLACVWARLGNLLADADEVMCRAGWRQDPMNAAARRGSGVGLRG